MRVLVERAESRKWTADARWSPRVSGLYELASNIDGFGKKGDLVWLLQVLPDVNRENPVFVVDAITGNLLQLP